MTTLVRIPADVDREDRLIGNLTARQLAILAATAAILYALWTFTARLLPAWSPTWAAASPGVRLAGFTLTAVPIAVAGLALTLGRRDGVPLDRLLLAAARQRLHTPTERREARPHTPRPDTQQDETADSGAASRRRARPGRVVVPWVPARDVRACITRPDVGVVGLGRDGLALVCAVTPVNLMLRSPSEQDQLVAGMARWLHSLTQPVQVLVRTTPLDLTGHISDLREDAARRPHPALAAAAHAHADHLTDLTHHTDLLRRRIYLVFHEPVPTGHTHPTGRDGGDGGRAGRIRRAVRAAEDQLLRRAEEADHLLTAIGARVTPLDPAATACALLAATNPDRHLYPPLPTSATHQRRPEPAISYPGPVVYDGPAGNSPGARRAPSPAGSPQAARGRTAHVGSTGPGLRDGDELLEAEDGTPTQPIPRPTPRSATRASGQAPRHGRPRHAPPPRRAPAREAPHR
jgi:hypothetical protein